MKNEHWAVKTRDRETWGNIKRLVIDPVTRRIISADVLLSNSGRLLRVPWENFRIIRQDIILRVPENQVHAAILKSQSRRSPGHTNAGPSVLGI
jgi:PRC-barrel domain.